MSFNLFNSDGSFDQSKFATAMRNLEFFSNLGMSASMITNQQGGDNSKPTGMSSTQRYKRHAQLAHGPQLYTG